MADLVKRSEEVDRAVQEILDEMAEVGRRASDAAKEAGRPSARLEKRPDLTSHAIERIKQVLYDEIPIASPVVGEAAIEPREEHREIAKRALTNIKLPQLRAIAEEAGLPRSGTQEEVIDRIVKRYRADEQEIARLVLLYEPEVPPELRISSRMFPLVEPITEFNDVVERISTYVGRYVRVGIARWFLVNAVNRRPQHLDVEGSYLYYRVEATQGPADPADESRRFGLSTSRSELPVTLTLRPDAPFIETIARGTREARAAVSAFAFLAGARLRDSLPTGPYAPIDELAGWDAYTILLVDLLNTFFRSEVVQVLNLTMAGFEMSPGHEETAEGEGARPRVKSVRFHGQHILDSVPACELIVRGERLASIQAVTRFSPTRDADYILPVRVDLERDHAAVLTSFGLSPEAVADQFHRLLTTALERSLDAGISDRLALIELARQVKARAATGEEEVNADVFGPRSHHEEDGEAVDGEHAE